MKTVIKWGLGALEVSLVLILALFVGTRGG